MKTIETIANWLVKQLDKLKMKNPIAFVFVQAILVVVLGLFENQTINIPTPEMLGKVISIFGIDSVNGLFQGVLLIVVALIGARTTQKLQQIQAVK